jgi:hypothetical protein
MADPCRQFHSNPLTNPSITYRDLVSRHGPPPQYAQPVINVIETLTGVSLTQPPILYPQPLLTSQSLSPLSSRTRELYELSPSATLPPMMMPVQIQGSPQYSAISSQEVRNGCVTSYVGRSGEDRYVTALLNGQIQLLAVFDGHGGNSVANYLRDNLPNKFAQALANVNFNDENAVSRAITNACIELDREMYNQKLQAGSTAIIALYSNNLLYLVNIGDSRAVVFNPQGQVLLETRDFKPNEEEERIRAAGGNVIRLYGMGA